MPLKKILIYTTHAPYETFLKSEWDQAAITRYFEIIGEASTKLDPEFKKEHEEIEWRDLTDFRNFLIHDYMDIDVKVVWDTMTINLPSLKEKIDRMLRTTLA